MDLQSKGVKLAIGLSNPGTDHENTYHNIGGIFIDFLENKNGKNPTIKKSEKLFRYSTYPNLILTRTSTFMNESGKAAAAAMKILKIKPEETILIHDDSDLKIGESKFSFGRGSGGHKGIESVIKVAKTKNFWRLRIGIRPARERIRTKAGNFVLKKIKTDDKKIFASLFQKISKENFNGI